jgi:ubiquinone/menaquinone biosynthesis C-methylase UbiE
VNAGRESGDENLHDKRPLAVSHSGTPMRFSATLVTLAALVLATPILAEDPPRYEMREDHDPSGLGKFYMGREIAHVMGHQAADWLERPEREEEEKTDLLVEALKFREGEVVADIGCGSGYVSRKIAKKVGESGVVYGVDIQEEMLELLAKRMAMFRINNVKPIMGTTTDPKLPPASCDTMIMVDVYHEFDQPFEMMQSMVAALKPGGRIVFVEYRGEDPSVPIKLVHKMTEAQVKKEMTAQSLEFVETIGILPRQHIIIFRKTDAKTADGKTCCQTPTSRAALLTRGAAK